MSKTIRILSTSININKPLKIALRTIYGIGPSRASLIIKELKLNEQLPIGKLSQQDCSRLIKILQEKKNKKSWLLEYELKRNIEKNIAKQIHIGSYVGLRHKLNLPVRGQRTHSNARTQRKLMRARYIR